jgi:hypothetical protein
LITYTLSYLGALGFVPKRGISSRAADPEGWILPAVAVAELKQRIVENFD